MGNIYISQCRLEAKQVTKMSLLRSLKTLDIRQ